MSETGFRRLAFNTCDLPERDRLAFCDAIARSLMGHDYRKIADIALAAGFIDLSYFNRSLRRRFGVTPSDLRATARRGRD